MKQYHIREELIDNYVKREANKKIRITAIGFALALLFIFILTYTYGIHKILVPPLLIMFLIITAIISISATSQTKNIANLTTFIISEDSISTFLNKEKLNLMNKIGVSRSESRYGMKFNQTIAFSKIESTTFGKNEIIIKSIDYDFFTSNGKITIPKEIESYDEIKSEITQKADAYKLTSS